VTQTVVDREFACRQTLGELPVDPELVAVTAQTDRDTVNAVRTFLICAEVKFPGRRQSRSAGRLIESMHFRRPTAASWRLCRERWRDDGLGSQVLGHEVGVLSQSVA
jgi:hypothetical protein